VGPGVSSSSRPGGLHEVFIYYYEIVRLKLEKMYGWSNFRGRPALATAEPVPRRRRACYADAFGVGGLDVNSRK
jgi:hypothetical protein